VNRGADADVDVGVASGPPRSRTPATSSTPSPADHAAGHVAGKGAERLRRPLVRPGREPPQDQ